MGTDEPAGAVFVAAFWWLPEVLGLIHGLAALGVDVVVNNKWALSKLPAGATEADKAFQRQRFASGWRASGHMHGLRAAADRVRECGVDVDCLALMREPAGIELFAYSVSGDGNGMPFYEEFVRDHVPAGRVAVMDGTDQANTFERREYDDMCRRGHVMFAREMPLAD